MRRPSNIALAIAVSVAIHVAVLAWVLSLAPAPAPRSQPVQPRWVEIQIIEAAPPVPEAPARLPEPSRRAPAKRRAAAAQATGERRSVEAATTLPPSAVAARSSEPAVASREQTQPVDPSRSGSPRAPRSLDLRPPAVTFSDARADIDPGGRTVRNDGSDDTAGRLAQEHARVSGRVHAWVTEDMASIRVNGGSKSSYFVELKNAFEDAVRRSALPKPQRGAFEDARRITDGVGREGGAMVRRYAQTGSPELARSVEERDVHHRVDANGYALAAAPMVTGEPEHRSAKAQIAQSIGQAAALNQLAAQLSASALKAIVEVQQRRSDGKLDSAALVQSSGNELFDELVIQAAFDAVTHLPPPPPGATGSHAALVRTVWEFAGKLQYRKKLRDIAPADRAVAIAAGVLSAPLTGLPFDETTGDVYLPDLANPELDCSATLLKLY